ncbi:helix-turn-helix domain-containing protein [Burkholderia sp. PR2]|uniref:helix-turn-helix domain-containing protein n=1 Tax=Burkholderia sp. PR2 TaxID=3448078 RepID=UPI00402A6ADC
MHRTALVTLNMRELDRLKVIQAVVDLGLRPGRAAERLGLTVRQIERLVIRYRESGAAGLTSRKRGRPGNRRLDEELARRALTIIRERYADFGPTLAEIDQAAVIEHKRLSHVLLVAQAIQAQRDNSRIGKAPSRTHRGDSTKTNRNTTQPNKKKQREFTQADVEKVIVDLAERRQPQQPARKPSRRSARGNDASVSTLPVQDPLFDTA